MSDAYIVVQHPCCGKALGRIVFGSAILPAYPSVECGLCGHKFRGMQGTRLLRADGKHGPLYPLSWLKKIPPLDESETRETRETRETDKEIAAFNRRSYEYGDGAKTLERLCPENKGERLGERVDHVP